MVKILKNTVGVSVGLTLLALTAHVAQAGTKPCPSCGGGSRPAGQTPPPNFVVPLPNGGTFVFTPPAPRSAPAASVSAPAPAVSVSAPAPTVSVSAPAPTVSVSAPAPTASVSAPVPTASVSAPAPTASASGSVASATTSASIQSGVNGFSGGLSIGSSISSSGFSPSSVTLQIMTQTLE